MNLEAPFKFTVGDHKELAEALCTVLGKDIVYAEAALWRYHSKSGLWRQVTSAEQSQVLQRFSGADTDKGKVKIRANDVTGASKLAGDKLAKPDFFYGSDSIAFSDGVVHATDTGIEHAPIGKQHRVRAGYTFPLGKQVPVAFVNFLRSVFRDDKDVDDKVQFVQEFFGACVMGIAPRYQRACIAEGEGENGKSVLASVLMQCMPSGTTSCIAPQDWGQEYRRAMLIGKHLNAVSELPERDIISSETFKAIVTGDQIIGRPIREAPVVFHPKAGHFFAANNLPNTPDQSEGFWRRFVVMPFTRSFKDDPERDSNIVPKLVAEKQEIVGWLVRGADRLIKRGKYVLPHSHFEAQRMWRLQSDPIQMFVAECLRPLTMDEPESMSMRASSLYSRYVTWCSRNGFRPETSTKVGRSMRKLGHGSKHRNSGSFYHLTVIDEPYATG